MSTRLTSSRAIPVFLGGSATGRATNGPRGYCDRGGALGPRWSSNRGIPDLVVLRTLVDALRAHGSPE